MPVNSVERKETNMKTAFLVSTTISLLAGMTPASATSYNATRMFQITANPGPVWSYLDGSGNVLSLTYQSGTGKKVITEWYNGAYYPNSSVVGRNRTGDPDQSYLTWPGKELLMDGQSVGAIVRFTTPVAGSYTIKGRFTGMNNTCTGVHPVTVAVNGVSVWTATITTYDVPSKFNLNQALNAGDIVDFINGYSGDPTCLGTGLIAKLDGP
jgi:hypothetical protein